MRGKMRFGMALLLVSGTLHADIGRIKSAVGEAVIERAGQRTPATAGMPLEEADALVTGKNSSISVTFVDNTRFSAGPNSRIELSRFRFNPTTLEGSSETAVRKGSLAIISGQIAKNGGDAMRVRTPSSILGVRGTKFVVDVGQ